MKRLISLLMLVVMIAGIMPIAVSAEEKGVDVIHFEDGSYMTVEVISGRTRASQSTTGSKKYTYYNSDGISKWNAVLTGSFSYNGSSATCSSSSVDVTIFDSDWYVISKYASKSGNTATASVTVGRRYDGSTIKVPVSLSLKCDANGNLS